MIDDMYYLCIAICILPLLLCQTNEAPVVERRWHGQGHGVQARTRQPSSAGHASIVAVCSMRLQPRTTRRNDARAHLNPLQHLACAHSGLQHDDLWQRCYWLADIKQHSFRAIPADFGYGLDLTAGMDRA